MLLQIFDSIISVISLIVPACLIFKYNLRGVVWGGLFLWVILLISGFILRFDPNRHAAILDALWLFVGWLPSLMYCMIIYMLRTIVFKFRRG